MIAIVKDVGSEYKSLVVWQIEMKVPKFFSYLRLKTSNQNFWKRKKWRKKKGVKEKLKMNESRGRREIQCKVEDEWDDTLEIQRDGTK